jgi:hypothetical protein
VTCLGTVALKRHWWGNRCACAIAPGYHVDDRLRLQHRLSRRLQRQVCRLCADRSFGKAREDLVEAFGVLLSTETLRQVGEQHGQQMARWQPQDSASTAAFAQAAGAVEFTIDAGKVNTLEEGWKDLKIAVLQKREAGEPTTATQWDQQRLPAATAQLAWGMIATSKQFCKGWRGWLKRVGVEHLADVHVLADGAEWIWRSVERVLTGCQQTLDIYHALEHVASASQTLYGEGSEAAQALLERGRHELLTAGWPGLCRLVDEEYALGDTPERRSALEKMMSYFAKHTTRLSYAARLQSGQAIGSGVVEGQAKTLGLRLKARGARWKKTNVKSMTALICVRNSHQWESYWGQAA